MNNYHVVIITFCYFLLGVRVGVILMRVTGIFRVTEHKKVGSVPVYHHHHPGFRLQTRLTKATARGIVSFSKVLRAEKRRPLSGSGGGGIHNRLYTTTVSKYVSK